MHSRSLCSFPPPYFNSLSFRTENVSVVFFFGIGIVKWTTVQKIKPRIRNQKRLATGEKPSPRTRLGSRRRQFHPYMLPNNFSSIIYGQTTIGENDLGVVVSLLVPVPIQGIVCLLVHGIQRPLPGIRVLNGTCSRDSERTFSR